MSISQNKVAVLVCVFTIAMGRLFYWLDTNTQHDGAFTKMYKTYDYIVVGGGSAGSVLAARLAEDRDVTVLILESGPSFGNNPSIYEPRRWLGQLLHQYDWNYVTEPQSNAFFGMKDRRGLWPRGHVFGGSGSINLLQYTRGSPIDFDNWEANGCSGWSYENVLPYFLKTEDMHIEEFKKSKYHNIGGEIAVRSGDESPLVDYFLNAGKELGYEITDYNGNAQEGFSKIQFNIRNGIRSSAGIEFYKSRKENLHICYGCHVSKIMIENKRAVGVNFIQNNRKQIIRATREISLSAGTINTPQILMLSGIGPKDHLLELGIPVIADLPVGFNLQDHQQVGLCAKINKTISNTPESVNDLWNTLRYKVFGSGPQSTGGSLASAFIHLDKNNRGKLVADIQFVLFGHFIGMDVFNYKEEIAREMIPDQDQMKDHGFCTFIGLTHPRARGTIRLHSKDPFDYPLIDPKYFTDPQDVKDLIGGIRVWEQMMETKSFQELGVDINIMKKSFCSHHQFSSDNYWDCFIRHTAFTQFHPTSTCKMGPKDDASAVVDLELRVAGLDGLRVVDASIFPNVTGGNTNAPTIMVAEKAADIIRKKDTVNDLRRAL